MAEDYYKILGVRRDASQAEIQKAFRELAKKYHPDRNPNDKDAVKKFQRIQRAFEVLNDREKRDMYDRYGSSFETRGTGGPRASYAWSTGPGGFSFEDVDFEQFFGDRFGAELGGGAFSDILRHFSRTAGRGRAKTADAKTRGGDIEHEIHIPFTTAITGGAVEMSVQRGSGQQDTLSVKIPPGIEDGKRIRLRGQGAPDPGGGPPGDMYLTVRVDPHAHFERRGDNLLARVPVTLAEAVLGAKIDVPTPKGTVSLRVPPGTSSGTKLRVKGHGVARKGQPPGDLLVELLVVLPKEIDASTREAIQRLDLRYDGDPRAQLRW